MCLSQQNNKTIIVFKKKIVSFQKQSLPEIEGIGNKDNNGEQFNSNVWVQIIRSPRCSAFVSALETHKSLSISKRSLYGSQFGLSRNEMVARSSGMTWISYWKMVVRSLKSYSPAEAKKLRSKGSGQSCLRICGASHQFHYRTWPLGKIWKRSSDFLDPVHMSLLHVMPVSLSLQGFPTRNTRLRLYIGGFPNQGKSDIRKVLTQQAGNGAEVGFIGCIKSLIINKQIIDLRQHPYTGDVFEGAGISELNVSKLSTERDCTLVVSRAFHEKGLKDFIYSIPPPSATTEKSKEKRLMWRSGRCSKSGR